jgi:hypothetical protein
MKRHRLLLLVLTTGVSTAGAFVTGEAMWILGGAIVAAFVAAWGTVGCLRHPRPLSLLPPTRSADGTLVPAQWFCSACGHSWTAFMDHPHPPVPRFVGHDEAKATAAAKRAATLEVRTRELAVLRSGIKATPVTKRTGPVPVQARRIS